MSYYSDILIIGSGVAGLYTALNIPDNFTVNLISKQKLEECNTSYAQGGIAAVLDVNDSFEKHIADTLEAGAGLCDRHSVEILVTEGPDKIRNLIELGANFTQHNGKLHLAKEGGHSDYRIVHAADLTGAEIERTLLTAVKQKSNIKLFDYHLAIDLITEHNVFDLKNEPINNRHCWGAYVLDTKSGQVHKFTSRFTVLASGGVGQVYFHTTNPKVATGDGYALAYRAGVKIANMEFVQFHPTSFYNPADHYDFNKTSFLISEAVRGFGGILKTQAGVPFMNKYDNRADLAPRDIVARAIDSEMKKRGDEFVYLDITHKPASEIKEHFPHIFAHCLEAGINIAKDMIPVVPAAHYECGGVMVDDQGRTSLQGLLAAGEVAMTGVHGANRLASNSLLEALVFGKRLADYVSSELKIGSRPLPNIPDWDDSGTLSAEEKVIITQCTREVKQIMAFYVGIVRSNLRLEMAANRLHILYLEIENLYKKTKVSPQLIELRNIISAAHIIIKSARFRQESRGLHFNVDYPQRDDTLYDAHTILQNRIL